MNFDDLPPAAKFIYMSMTKSAIFLKEMGKDRDFFLDMCKETWNSMEMSDIEYLKSVLDDAMKKDIMPYVESYIKKSQSRGNQ